MFDTLSPSLYPFGNMFSWFGYAKGGGGVVYLKNVFPFALYRFGRPHVTNRFQGWDGMGYASVEGGGMVVIHLDERCTAATWNGRHPPLLPRQLSTAQHRESPFFCWLVQGRAERTVGVGVSGGRWW